jgi:hypothetical protein
VKLPEAEVVHRSGERLRIRVASRKGDEAFFAALERRLTDEGAIAAARPLTGSILITGDLASPDWVKAMGARTQSFDLTVVNRRKVTPSAAHLVSPIGALNRYVRRFTNDELDIFGAVFILLMTTGIIQVLRGNLRLPPWYTAFWYAFGIFTKSILDRIDTDPFPSAD